VVCSAEVAAAGELAAGIPAGLGPAQWCPHRSAGTAGITGAEQPLAQADISPGIGWRQAIISPILELPVVEQRRGLRSRIYFCETHTQQGKAAGGDKGQTGPCSDEPISMGGQEPLWLISLAH